MDSNADALTLLIILAVFMWEARVIAKNLEGRADRQLQRPTLGSPEPNMRREQPDRPRRLAGDAPSLSEPDARGLDDIRRDYPAFDADRFLDSVRLVYEAVVVAFANGDGEVLRDLLSREVFDTFSQEIAAREERREQIELSFIGLKRAEIVDASAVNGRMQITVDFESALVSVTRNQSGRIVDGNPAQIITACDRWTFTKERAARSPVWRLAATESPPADDRAAISSEQA